MEESFENNENRIGEFAETSDDVIQGQISSLNGEINSEVFDEVVETQYLPSLTPPSQKSTELEESIPQVTSNPIILHVTTEPSINDPGTVPIVTVENLAPRYPQRINKGVPKKQYEPDLKATTKYPINKYISDHRLSRSYALTVNQLPSVAIPNSVQDALSDPKW